ncbi:MAG: LacI family DNA-binding transcriptional regulator [Candidatus Brocadiia bacterium]
MAVTLQDIAESTGTDKATVSRVLQGKARDYYISREREERIREAARDMGYRPNGGAHLPRVLQEEMTDGLLIAAKKDLPDPMTNVMRKADIPAIWLTHDLPYDCIREDHVGGGQKATNYLIELGHRRIAYLGRKWSGITNPENPGEKDGRYEGYTLALDKIGEQPRKMVPKNKSSGRRETIRRHLTGDNRATAVLAAWHELAEDVLLTALELGLRVPRDLSVMEFHPTGKTESHSPITAVTVNEYRKGTIAVEMLQEKIENPNRQLKSHVMTMELSKGRTCAKLKD